MKTKIKSQQQGSGSMMLSNTHWQYLLKLNGGDFFEDRNGFKFTAIDNEYTLKIPKSNFVTVHNPLLESYSFYDFFGNAFITRILNSDGSFGFIIESPSTPNGFRLLLVIV
jgi:hypothetical protein